MPNPLSGDRPPPPPDQVPPARISRPAPAPSPEERGLAWVKWLGLLFLVAVVGGAFYQFYWKYRLPQDHVLVDRKGNRYEARLVARAGEVLKYTLLKDGSTHFVTSESLSDGDQALLHGLKSELTLTPPLAATLIDVSGDVLTGEVLGRNAKFVKIALNDGTTRYVPLEQLSELDAAWVRLLPSNLSFTYPVNYALTLPGGKVFDVQILGRSDKLLRVRLSGDGSVHVYPLDVLSAADQVFSRNLPINQTIGYPIEFPLTTKDGRTIDAIVQGHSANSVRYRMADDKQVHTEPLADFSQKSQDYVRTWPANFTDAFSFERTLETDKGATYDAQLLGRSDKLLKFNLRTNGNIYYFPLANLSADDQKYVGQLAAGLDFTYPLDYTLTDPRNNQPLPIRITALTDSSIKYVVAATGRNFDSSLTALAPIDQTVLHMLPPSPVVATHPAPEKPAAERPRTPAQITQEVVETMKHSGIYGGELTIQVMYSGDAIPRVRDGTVWQWLQRISGPNNFVGEDYRDFMKQDAMQKDIKACIADGVAKLQAIRTKENAGQVDLLISSAKRATDSMDTITRGSPTVNRNATSQIADFMKRWEQGR